MPRELKFPITVKGLIRKAPVDPKPFHLKDMAGQVANADAFGGGLPELFWRQAAQGFVDEVEIVCMQAQKEVRCWVVHSCIEQVVVVHSISTSAVCTAQYGLLGGGPIELALLYVP